MKCPECGEEMEEGYVMTSGNMFWSKKKKRIAWIWDTELHRFFPIKFYNYLPRLVAYRCSKCELVIFYYGKKGEKLLKEKEDKEKG